MGPALAVKTGKDVVQTASCRGAPWTRPRALHFARSCQADSSSSRSYEARAFAYSWWSRCAASTKAESGTGCHEARAFTPTWSCSAASSCYEGCSSRGWSDLGARTLVRCARCSAR